MTCTWCTSPELGTVPCGPPSALTGGLRSHSDKIFILINSSIELLHQLVRSLTASRASSKSPVHSTYVPLDLNVCPKLLQQSLTIASIILAITYVQVLLKDWLGAHKAVNSLQTVLSKANWYILKSTCSCVKSLPTTHNIQLCVTASGSTFF